MLADTNLRQQTRTRLDTYDPSHWEDHLQKEETRWPTCPARLAAVPKFLCQPSTWGSRDPCHMTWTWWDHTASKTRSGAPRRCWTSVARTLKKWSLKWRKMFESNSNNFLDTLLKETHPILPNNFIWKNNKKTSTLGQMLKKEHKTSNAFTIAQLFGWS